MLSKAYAPDSSVTIPSVNPTRAPDFTTVPVATQGTVRLISQTADDSTQDVVLRGGKFEVRQAKDGSGITEFVLRGEDFSACGRATASAKIAPFNPTSFGKPKIGKSTSADAP